MLLAPASSAQATSKVSLETSETLFTLLAGLNQCGYDQELAASDPLRTKVRADVAKVAYDSPVASAATNQLCRFYKDHQQADSGRDLAQYISLGLNLGEPPNFSPTTKESDLPPDAAYVLGVVPLLQALYANAGLHEIWERHSHEYQALIERFHDPVSKMIFQTDIYLRQPISGYLGRRMEIYLEPLAAPGQVNARNYGSEYALVVSPVGNSISMDQVRHTYLHYVLDPLALKRATTLKRLAPLLDSVATAPLDESFKRDISLLVTESLIRAMEARLGKNSEPARAQAVQASMSDGFILTRYFFDALAQFEKDATGLKDAYPEWLFNLNVDREKKRAREVQFSAKAAPEVLRASNAEKAPLLDLAERRLASGDIDSARKLAQQALDEKQGDSARALFILARAATLNRDMAGARGYFERTLQVASEPRVVAWSHIYLGRIFDLQENRGAALEHYRAALSAGDAAPETKAAAERGLKQPYEPPSSRQ